MSSLPAMRCRASGEAVSPGFASLLVSPLMEALFSLPCGAGGFGRLTDKGKPPPRQGP